MEILAFLAPHDLALDVGREQLGGPISARGTRQVGCGSLRFQLSHHACQPCSVLRDTIADGVSHHIFRVDIHRVETVMVGTVEVKIVVIDIVRVEIVWVEF